MSIHTLGCLAGDGDGMAVHIAPGGAVRDFIAAGQDGIGSVIGVRVDPRTNTLWANSLSSTEGSGVFHYDLATSRLIKK